MKTKMTLERFTSVLKEAYNVKLQNIASNPQLKHEYDEEFVLKMHASKHKLYKDELPKLFKKHHMIDTNFDERNPRVQAYHADCHHLWTTLNDMIRCPELYS